MDQKENYKVLLLSRSASADQAAAWARLSKALKTLGTSEVREVDSISAADLRSLSAQYNHVFLELELADAQALARDSISNLILMQAEALPWNDAKIRGLWEPVLLSHSCLVLENTNPADLVRVLHVFANGKRMAGVTPMLEKGSLVVAEKVQSLESIGYMADRLMQFLTKLEGFELKDRAMDLRLVLGAVVSEAFERVLESKQPYPTVDFQVGASSNKLVVNLRFARGNLDLANLRALAIGGQSLAWQQAWAYCDVALVTHHVQFDEIELMLVLNQRKRANSAHFRSLLVRASDRSPKKENLLASPQNYEFRLLSEIRVNQQDQVYASTDLSEDPSLDLNALPESVVKKLEKLTEEREFFQLQSKKREEQIRAAAQKMVQANREISLKRSELLKVTKSGEGQVEQLQREISSLERRLLQQQSSSAAQSAAKDSGVSAQAMQELKVKLDASLRSAENERHNANEKIANEQRKVTSYEQKYSALFKDLAAKEKDIRDLKAAALKNQKHPAQGPSAETGSANGGALEALQAKLKETESRETTLKQEVKRVTFKSENAEKHMKALQLESSEKIKLLEEKLKEAKTKEVELLKKVEEVSGALKKASKAA